MANSVEVKQIDLYAKRDHSHNESRYSSNISTGSRVKQEFKPDRTALLYSTARAKKAYKNVKEFKT